VLLLAFAGSRDTIETAFNRAEYRRQECAIAVEDAVHVAAERLHEQNDDPAIDEDLYPSVESHGFPCLASEAFWANEGVCQVDEQEQGHAATDDVIDKHGRSFRLKIVAGFDVGEGNGEKQNLDPDDDNIHCVVPCFCLYLASEAGEPEIPRKQPTMP
jgi:hypothetical protein